MVRRGKLDITSDILIEAAPKGESDEDIANGAKITHIMNNAGLSYEQLNPYLKKLTRFKFLKNENEKYTTTQRGLKYLEKYHELKTLLK